MGFHPLGYEGHLSLESPNGGNATSRTPSLRQHFEHTSHIPSYILIATVLNLATVGGDMHGRRDALLELIPPEGCIIIYCHPACHDQCENRMKWHQKRKNTMTYHFTTQTFENFSQCKIEVARLQNGEEMLSVSKLGAPNSPWTGELEKNVVNFRHNYRSGARPVWSTDRICRTPLFWS